MSTQSNDPARRESTPKQPAAERILALLLGYSKLIAFVVVVIFAIASWPDLRSLLPRVSHFKALGVEVEVSQLEVALRRQAESVKAPNVEIQPDEINAVLGRAVKVKSVFEGATVLWVDDEPANNLPFRQLLRKLGGGVEPARTTEEALELASHASFDLVVSDMKRPNESGIDGLAKLRSAGVTCPAIFYVLHLEPDKPVPQGALGITNRPDVLLNLVIDALERSRWSQLNLAAEPLPPADHLR